MDRIHNAARTSDIEEELTEIEHSYSEGTSIDAFKRIRFDKWASDTRKEQENMYQSMIDLHRIEALDRLQKYPIVSQIFCFSRL